MYMCVYMLHDILNTNKGYAFMCMHVLTCYMCVYTYMCTCMCMYACMYNMYPQVLHCVCARPAVCRSPRASTRPSVRPVIPAPPLRSAQERANDDRA